MLTSELWEERGACLGDPGAVSCPFSLEGTWTAGTQHLRGPCVGGGGIQRTLGPFVAPRTPSRGPGKDPERKSDPVPLDVLSSGRVRPRRVGRADCSKRAGARPLLQDHSWGQPRAPAFPPRGVRASGGLSLAAAGR